MTVTLEEQAKLEGLKGLLAALKGRGMHFGLHDFIELSGSSIYFDYGEDLTVVVPLTGDFGRRAACLQRSLETLQESGEKVRGTLDLTSGDSEARLLPERWLPENWTRREPQDGGDSTAEPGGGDNLPGDSGQPDPGEPVPPDIPGGDEPAGAAPEE